VRTDFTLEPKKFTAAFKSGTDAANARYAADFAYMVWDREGSSWRGALLDQNGAQLARCKLSDRRLTCKQCVDPQLNNQAFHHVMFRVEPKPDVGGPIRSAAEGPQQFQSGAASDKLGISSDSASLWGFGGKS
jgi:hypothetical protein